MHLGTCKCFRVAEDLDKYADGSVLMNHHAFSIAVHGHPKHMYNETPTLLKEIGTRSSRNRQLMEVGITKGKKAITNYKTLEVFALNIPLKKPIKMSGITVQNAQNIFYLFFPLNFQKISYDPYI